MTCIEQALETARRADATRRETARTEYAAFVDAVARGKKFDAAALSRCLDAAGVEFPAFEAAARRLAQRIGWAADAADLQKRQTRVDVAEQKIKDLDAAFVAQVERLRAETISAQATIRTEATEARKSLSVATFAVSQLQGTALDAVIDRAHSLRRAAGDAYQVLARRTRDLQGLDDSIEGAKAKAAKAHGRLFSPVAATLMATERDKAQRQLADAEREIVDLTACVPGVREAVNQAEAAHRDAERAAADAEAEILVP